MKTSPFDRLPFFVNLENLGDDEEIRIDYDTDGNPVRIRRVRVDNTWVLWVVGAIVGLFFLFFYEH